MNTQHARIEKKSSCVAYNNCLSVAFTSPSNAFLYRAKNTTEYRCFQQVVDTSSRRDGSLFQCHCTTARPEFKGGESDERQELTRDLEHGLEKDGTYRGGNVNLPP